LGIYLKVFTITLIPSVRYSQSLVHLYTKDYRSIWHNFAELLYQKGRVQFLCPTVYNNRVSQTELNNNVKTQQHYHVRRTTQGHRQSIN